MAEPDLSDQALKPRPSSAEAPERPRSSSMTTTWSPLPTSWRARSAAAHTVQPRRFPVRLTWRSVDRRTSNCVAIAMAGLDSSRRRNRVSKASTSASMAGLPTADRQPPGQRRRISTTQTSASRLIGSVVHRQVCPLSVMAPRKPAGEQHQKLG